MSSFAQRHSVLKDLHSAISAIARDNEHVAVTIADVEMTLPQLAFHILLQIPKAGGLLSSFPPEIVHRCLKFLPVMDLKAVSLTSRALHEVAQTLLPAKLSVMISWLDSDQPTTVFSKLSDGAHLDLLRFVKRYHICFPEAGNHHPFELLNLQTAVDALPFMTSLQELHFEGDADFDTDALRCVYDALCSPSLSPNP